jgi:hypothetical protein
MSASPERSRRLNRRWLNRLIVSIAAAAFVVGVFWLGVWVGEMRGGTAPAFGKEGPEHPGGRSGWQDRRGGHGDLGVVEQIEDETIVITGRWNNRLKVVITGETVFKRGREPIRLADVQVGDRIAVVGEPSGEEELEAKIIWVIAKDSFHREGQRPPPGAGPAKSAVVSSNGSP